VCAWKATGEIDERVDGKMLVRRAGIFPKRFAVTRAQLRDARAIFGHSKLASDPQ